MADSFLARWDGGIMLSYRTIISPTHSEPHIDVAADFIHTITANIELFLRDKTNKMSLQIEHASDQFPEFWRAIGAEGDLNLALQEFLTRYNPREA